MSACLLITARHHSDLTKEQRKAREEAIVDVAGCRNRLWTRVPVQGVSALLCLGSAHELLPLLELFRLGEL